MATPNVFAERPEYERRSNLRRLISDLLEGTEAFLRDPERWLRKWPRETPTAYQERVEQVLVLGAFSGAIDRIVSKPFSQQMTVEGVPTEYEYLVTQPVRGADKTLQAFAFDQFARKIAYGASYTLVTMPPRSEATGPGGEVTIGDQQVRGFRPMLSWIHPNAVIGWETDPMTGVVTEVRVRSVSVEWDDEGGPDRAGGYTERQRVTVYTPSMVTTWERDPRDRKKLSVIQEDANELGEIPIIPDYADDDGPYQPIPPLSDLAWANLAHTRSWLNQRMALAYAQAGLLVEFGASDEGKGPVFSGPGSFLRREAGPQDADIRFVEPTEVGVVAGQKDLESQVAMMETLGSQPLVRRSGDATATARAADEAKTETVAQSWVRDTEGSVAKWFAMAGRWEGRDVDVAVSIFSEFGIQGGEQVCDEYRLIQADADAGIVTQRTRLREAKRRGIYHEEMDPETELEDATAEAAERIPITQAGDGDPPPEE